jgi:hypothetical protein
VKRFRVGLDSAVLVALIGILSGVIGAYATAAATSRATLRQNIIEFRKKAYAEFLEGQSLRRGARDESDDREANRLIIDAKLNIFMVASKDVICSMVDYWVDAFGSQYPSCKDDQMELKNAAIYQAMRSEFFASLGMQHPELEPALIVPYVANPSCVLSGTNSTNLQRICPSSLHAK